MRLGECADGVAPGTRVSGSDTICPRARVFLHFSKRARVAAGAERGKETRKQEEGYDKHENGAKCRESATAKHDWRTHMELTPVSSYR